MIDSITTSLAEELCEFFRRILQVGYCDSVHPYPGHKAISITRHDTAIEESPRMIARLQIEGDQMVIQPFIMKSNGPIRLKMAEPDSIGNAIEALFQIALDDCREMTRALIKQRTQRDRNDRESRQLAVIALADDIRKARQRFIATYRRATVAHGRY